jgi:hypothetical protein
MSDRPVYVRFVAGAPAENPYWSTGVVTTARILRDERKLESYEVERLEEIYVWFNEHLPCPPFKEKRTSGEWTADAVAWFRDDAREAISQMWEIVALLKEHGISVRFFQSESPGMIVYADDFQVVAETPRDA